MDEREGRRKAVVSGRKSKEWSGGGGDRRYKAIQRQASKK